MPGEAPEAGDQSPDAIEAQEIEDDAVNIGDITKGAIPGANNSKVKPIFIEDCIYHINKAKRVAAGIWARFLFLN